MRVQLSGGQQGSPMAPEAYWETGRKQCFREHTADPQAGPGMINEGGSCPACSGSGAPGDL